jgi:hypothetical protein
MEMEEKERVGSTTYTFTYSHVIDALVACDTSSNLRLILIPVTGAVVGVKENRDKRPSPAKDIESLQKGRVGPNEGQNEECMEVESLTKHPKVVGNHEVVDEDVEGLAPGLDNK